VLAGTIALVGLTVWYLVIPYPWTLRGRNPERTSLIAQRVAEIRASGATLDVHQEWVTLEDISPALVRAVVVAEDYRFRQHHGIDWVSLAEEVHWTGDAEFSWWSAADLRALRSALGYAWTNRSEMRGRSTITQQLAKNLYFGTDRSLLRKAMEFVVARRLERRLGKDRILELYLNIAEWGPGVFGAEAAARTYFGRSASSLTLPEAAALAGTLPHPLTSNPSHNPGRMRWRQNLILDRLDPSRGLPPPPGPLPEIEIDLIETAIPALEPLGTSPPPPESPVVVPDTL
jgi:monofunctional biosynthetic peptidoglycan transglycosylase